MYTSICIKKLVRSYIDSGLTAPEIAKEEGCSDRTVRRVKHVDLSLHVQKKSSPSVNNESYSKKKVIFLLDQKKLQP